MRWAGRDTEGLRDLRREAIVHTSAFLSWALAGERGLPRIPTRPVDQGGFRGLLRLPGAREKVRQCWDGLLEQVERLYP